FRMALYSSALNFRAVACSDEKPRSSSTFPRVTCVGLRALLFMFLLLCQTGSHCSKLPRRSPSRQCGGGGQALSLVSRAETASRASCAAWKVAWGKPPNASEICSGVRDLISVNPLPTSNSVSNEEHAIEV